jgi:hypothetical protein
MIKSLRRKRRNLAKGTLIIFEKPPRFHIQSLGDAGDVVDRDVAFRPLDAAHVRAMDPAAVGEHLLAELEFRPPLPHVLRQNVAQRTFVGAFHLPMGTCCSFYGDSR